MNGIENLAAASLRGDLLWYVAHPVHPTDEEVTAYRKREDEVIAYQRLAYETTGSIGFVVERRKSDHEVREEIVRGNIANAKAWLAWLIRRFPAITFIMPWAAALDGGGDDDLDPVQRSRGLRDCCRTIRVCCGVIHVGGRVSGGMIQEAEHAWNVVDLTYLGREPPASNTEVTA